MTIGAAAALDQRLHGHLEGVVDAGEVDVDDVLPLVSAGRSTPIGAMPALASTMSTPPSCATPSSNAGLQRVAVADVGLAGDDPPVQRLDLLDGLGQVSGVDIGYAHRVDLLADVDGDDVGALLGQPDGVAAALAARRAGDEGDLALELCPCACLLPLCHEKPASTGRVTPVT